MNIEPLDSPSTPPRVEAWRASGQRFGFHGHDFYYRDSGGAGAARVLLLLHGFPTSSFDWLALWTPLAAHFRVVTLDLLGFGFSDKPARGPYRIALQADLVEALLTHLRIARVHLLAHDYGDTVAQELLARDAVRCAAGMPAPAIASACLLNGGLFPESHRPRFVQRLLAGPLGPALVRVAGARGFKRSLAAVFGPATQPSAETLEEFWIIASERDGHLRLPQLIGYMAERRAQRTRWVGALQLCTRPLRLIDGLDDPVSGAHMVARYRELVPRPDVVELTGIGHYPQCEAPQAVLRAVMDFHDARVA